MNTDDEARWIKLTGGYRVQYDPRPALLQFRTGSDCVSAWRELWENLHHQGDVGEASYASVPPLVEIHKHRGTVDGNTYGIVAMIELARTNGKNPPVPSWLQREYFHAIKELARIGAMEIFRSDEPDTTASIMSVIAVAKGLRIHANFLLMYSETEIADIASRR